MSRAPGPPSTDQTAAIEIGRSIVEAAQGRDWMFLGVRITPLSSPQEPVVVAEAILPAGASPPLHVHDHLDDSFYLLAGTMVVRCGEDVTVAEPGAWIPFPHAVPHTFRVIGGDARVLMVHANASFIQAVQAIGRPASDTDAPTTDDGPSLEELTQAMAEHDIRAVGPPMEAAEAHSWLLRLGAGVTRPAGPRRPG